MQRIKSKLWGGDLTSSGACEGSFSMIIIDRKLFCERTIFSRRIEIVSLILNSRHPTPETKGGYRISPPLFFLACTIAGALQVTASYTFVFNWWPVIAADRDRVDQRRKNISTDIVFNSVCLTIILFSNFRKKSQGILRVQTIGWSSLLILNTTASAHTVQWGGNVSSANVTSGSRSRETFSIFELFAKSLRNTQLSPGHA